MSDPTDPASYSGYAEPADANPSSAPRAVRAARSMPTGRPAPPPPGAPEPVLLTIGDIAVNAPNLVIVGADGRVPPELRPAFFAQMVDHYRRYLPPGGYPVPPGVNGFKHRFLQWHAYGVYAAVRNVYRAGRRAQRTVVPWATAPVRAATWRSGSTRSSARQPTAWRQSR